MSKKKMAGIFAAGAAVGGLIAGGIVGMTKILKKKNADAAGGEPVPAAVSTMEVETIKEGDLEIESFLCPITQELMKDPVRTPYGHAFERENIELWITKHANCPITRQPLRKEDLMPDYTVKSAITEYQQKVLKN